MTTRGIALKSFALDAQEGRTQQPIDVLGSEMLVKLADQDSGGGNLAIFHQNVPPMSGPPLHRHSREDEWFYNLEGQVTFQVDGKQIILRAGASAFTPRGTTHTFQNFGPATARMLVIVTPGSFQRFFEELSSVNRGLSTPDLVRTERLMKEYGVEPLGPPLS